MKYLFLFILFTATTDLFSQSIRKKTDVSRADSLRIVDTSVLNKWPYVSAPKLSDDGKYYSYRIENQPLKNRTLVIQDTGNTWKKEFTGVYYCFFSSNNQEAFFQSNDSLYFLSLGTDHISVIGKVKSYKTAQAGNGEWLAYQLNGDTNELVLKNTGSKKSVSFQSVSDYSFDNAGRVLYLKKEEKTDKGFASSIIWLNLKEGKEITIWTMADSSTSEFSISDFRFDDAGRQLIFIVNQKKNGLDSRSIWYYKEGLQKAILMVSNQSQGVDTGLSVSGGLQFSKNGDWIFFELQEKMDEIQAKTGAVNVDIWSYRDVTIQPDQQWRIKREMPQKYMAVVNAQNGHIVRLEKENETQVTAPRVITGNYVVIMDQKRTQEFWWTLSPQPSFYVMSLADGSRTILKKQVKSLNNFCFSPSGRYLIYYDWKQKSYFSYNLSTSKVNNITRSIPVIFNNEYSLSRIPFAVAKVAGWLENEDAFFIYDNYDIWLVDAGNEKKPINVTNGYGLANHLKLRIVNESENKVFKRDEALLLTAFNSVNKYNGFYRAYVNKNSAPELLTLGPYTYYRTESQKLHESSFGNGIIPVKANGANVWLVERQTERDAPNYYITGDFKTYTSLTRLRPQAGFNWLKSELITWKQLDGTLAQGILYKPTDFDPNKKYPVIFNYYEIMSHRLYEFPYPEVIENNINIPLFVSNGYLVFTPDMHYEMAGKNGITTGESAYNAVVLRRGIYPGFHMLMGKKWLYRGIVLAAV